MIRRLLNLYPWRPLQAPAYIGGSCLCATTTTVALANPVPLVVIANPVPSVLIVTDHSALLESTGVYVQAKNEGGHNYASLGGETTGVKT